MAFKLPSGLRIVGERAVAGDGEVAAVEDSLPSGTRMLVAVGFAFKWPGFGWSADQADGVARSLAGLQPWPEYGRVVTADPDGEAIWWISYRSSPAWWMPVLIALGVLILAAVSFRIVRWVAPEIAQPIGDILQLLPLMVLVLVMSIALQLPSILKELAPVASVAAKRKLGAGG